MSTEEEAPPVALPLPEPEVKAIVGGDVTLRCLFHSNPPPKVTWKKGEISVRMTLEMMNE